MNTNLSFAYRHMGINETEKEAMLASLGLANMAELIDKTVPDNILMNKELDLPEAVSEYEYLKQIRAIEGMNKIFNNFIGQGYYGTVTPSVILRNIFQNPGWYTQYTPYQAEISQGRMEALLNFQTMVSDLTGLPLANASLLDEGTAAAEAMSMCFGLSRKKLKDSPARYFVDQNVFDHTLAVIMSRAEPLDIEIVVGDWKQADVDDSFFGVLIQYPDKTGHISDYKTFCEKLNALEVYVTVAADLMSLALLTPPGEWGADIVVGNTQRFGIPMGYGGPHAAFFATKEEFKRQIPGRIIGVSVDVHGRPALRMALQTREQHIKREKATSNICTAQALLAVMAGMYGCYHGQEGLCAIAHQIHDNVCTLAERLVHNGFELVSNTFFDTIGIRLEPAELAAVRASAEDHRTNFFYAKDAVYMSFDETHNQEDLNRIMDIMRLSAPAKSGGGTGLSFGIPSNLKRTSDFLTHPVFSAYRTETKMMRYIKSLENKDLSLMHSMIPLGSCTMKLNAATQLIPVTWDGFSNLHPFAPVEQAKGYHTIFEALSRYLSEITGFAGCTLQPNSGAQGEYTGLMLIRAYHKDKGQSHRNVTLIPSSAHGTNPASAIMAGMKVVVVDCDEDGNINIDDLRAKADTYKDALAGFMVTYPSTHGVFEESIIEACDIVHTNGGLVYMDGANMNAQVGLTSPGLIKADVCHLNLHKTFSIPHGGGGPGMGPVCVNDKLLPYLPGHALVKTGGNKAIQSIASAPWGSASILLISYAYIRLLGQKGVKTATEIAILNANYIRKHLEEAFDVLYTGKMGFCAHELIIDLRDFKKIGITAEDVSKRLMDYGFHAPTVSFPVPGTIMIEPTESEDKDELDRFITAMLTIRNEIRDVELSLVDSADNVLKNAPHTLSVLTADNWPHSYTREQAAFPADYLRDGHKFWASVGRVDNAYGDRHLMCTCPPMSVYENVED